MKTWIFDAILIHFVMEKGEVATEPTSREIQFVSPMTDPWMMVYLYLPKITIKNVGKY